MTAMLTSPELALFERLIDVGKLLEKRADRATRQGVGLKYSQYEVLIRLRNAGGELRMAELANKLVSYPSGLTYHLDQLEKAGLATRATAPDDERGVLAQITDRGRQFLLDAFDSQTEMIEDAVVRPLDSATIEAVSSALGVLQVHLRGEATGGMLPN
ncbi:MULTISPECIES: MarR family winged helix-turn-helix transcriptional regulator [unclassified Microbacterium]|uniref:MarR family winged helix-turn-helix transcriptional regulator n=1 Tax=unclassified Microbacterium TaxID=2609290 RepID=UPI0037465082